MTRTNSLWILALLFTTPLFAQEKPAFPGDKTSESTSSTIVFFREGHYAGSGLKPSIFVDGKEVGRLPNGRWFQVSAEPGKHELQSSAKNEPATIVNTTAGQTTYVQMVIVPGTWRGAGRLLEVDAKEAQNRIAKLKVVGEKESGESK
jgi:hypothetical protein